jgi:hypothetical protein
MRALKDPKIDELRDVEGRFFGKAPVQGWPKPISVSFHRPTIRDLLQGSMVVDLGGPTDLGFIMHAPWAAPQEVSYVRPTRRVLEQFLCLDLASDAELQDFASKFGPLLIFCRPGATADESKEIIHERSEVWRYFARSMKALLRIAVSFHSGRRSDPSDWDFIGNCPFPVLSAKQRIKDADVRNPLSFQPEESWSAMAYFIGTGEHRDRAMWVRLINGLLQLGRARPVVAWEGSGATAWPRMAFAAPRLLSFLALQLCLTALKQDAFPTCSFCRREYSPKRAPKAGQRNFCPDCRANGVPVLIAQRSRRERLREKR